LVFSSNRQGSWDIYLAQPNGQEVQRLTTEAGVETRPTFSPDGQEIYYLTNTPGSWWIMAMNPDGNNKRVVKEGVASIKLTNWNRLGIAIK
jgi:TolB protein